MKDPITLNNLRKLTISRKNGQELFHASGASLGFDLLSFWQWSASDLVTNVSRGRLAEYIVAHALGIDTVELGMNGLHLTCKRLPV